MMQIVYVDKTGVHIEEPKKIKVNWELKSFKETLNEKIHGITIS